MSSATENRAARVALYAVVALIALIMAPNLVWLGAGDSFSANWRSAVLMPVGMLSLLFAIFAKRIWIACLLLTPFAALVPVEVFYISIYKHPSTAPVLATIFATNTEETLAYFGNRLWLLIGCAAICVLLSLLASRAAFKAHASWRHRSRIWVIGCSVLLGLALVFLGGLRAIHGGAMSFRAAAMAPLQLPLIEITSSYPFGVVSRLLEYFSERQTMAESASALNSYRFGATHVRSQQKREIYVLVIGESSSREHWQLFGYMRQTTPELVAIENLVPIENMLSSWPASIFAIPLVITRKPIADQHLGWNEPSIVRVMREAGYDTWWISNQLAMGELDSPISLYALEADHTLFLNRTAGERERSYDELLLQPLDDAISRSNKNLFIVLHTMGSHQAYDARYPSQFARFTPVLDDEENDVPPALRAINSYDNTIFYTDHVLSGVIRVLRQSGAITALWYESDHGETMPTPSCPKAGHGLDSRSEFEVPALVWYSENYAELFPERVRAIRENAGEKTLTGSTFESLLDMTGVEIPKRDPTWSLFSLQWKYHDRLVNLMTRTTFGAQANFDEASFDNDCSIPQRRPESADR